MSWSHRTLRKLGWGQRHECTLSWVHAGQERGLSTLVPLFCTGILAVMLQKVVAVSMVGRTLVLFFNFIPWAREGKTENTITKSLSAQIFTLSMSHERSWQEVCNKNQLDTDPTDPGRGRCCIEALNTWTCPCPFLGSQKGRNISAVLEVLTKNYLPTDIHTREVSH